MGRKSSTSSSSSDDESDSPKPSSSSSASSDKLLDIRRSSSSKANSGSARTSRSRSSSQKKNTKKGKATGKVKKQADRVHTKAKEKVKEEVNAKLKDSIKSKERQKLENKKSDKGKAKEEVKTKEKGIEGANKEKAKKDSNAKEKDKAKATSKAKEKGRDKAKDKTKDKAKEGRQKQKSKGSERSSCSSDNRKEKKDKDAKKRKRGQSNERAKHKDERPKVKINVAKQKKDIAKDPVKDKKKDRDTSKTKDKAKVKPTSSSTESGSEESVGSSKVVRGKPKENPRAREGVSEVGSVKVPAKEKPTVNEATKLSDAIERAKDRCEEKDSSSSRGEVSPPRQERILAVASSKRSPSSRGAKRKRPLSATSTSSSRNGRVRRQPAVGVGRLADLEAVSDSDREGKGGLAKGDDSGRAERVWPILVATGRWSFHLLPALFDFVDVSAPTKSANIDLYDPLAPVSALAARGPAGSSLSALLRGGVAPPVGLYPTTSAPSPPAIPVHAVTGAALAQQQQQQQLNRAQVCFNYTNGRCFREGCRFLHVGPGTSAGAAGAVSGVGQQHLAGTQGLAAWTMA